jgi:hypothetical protein
MCDPLSQSVVPSMQRQRKSALRRHLFPFRAMVYASILRGRALSGRLSHERSRLLSVIAFVVLLTVAATQAQQVQFSRGFQGPGQNANPSPAESKAYAAAMSQPDPAAKVSAIQQFLINYPNSTLRQPAIAEMMMAKRALQGTGSPASSMINPAMPSQPAPAAAFAPAVPASAPAESVPMAPQAYGAPAKSLLQEAPKPAKVTVAAHSLTIMADNSALSQILQEISGSTGMKVDGLSQDQRIFGSYGPGDAREVLLALLEGSGYNVVMMGDTGSGAPRELSLTQRAAATTASSGPAAKTTGEEEDDSEDVQQTPQPEPVQPQPVVNQPPPGGLQNPDGTQPRTPQEMQQDFLRLRQQQQQQQPQQQLPQQQ